MSHHQKAIISLERDIAKFRASMERDSANGDGTYIAHYKLQLDRAEGELKRLRTMTPQEIDDYNDEAERAYLHDSRFACLGF